jgi:hypothetical protein
VQEERAFCAVAATGAASLRACFYRRRPYTHGASHRAIFSEACKSEALPATLRAPRHTLAGAMLAFCSARRNVSRSLIRFWYPERLGKEEIPRDLSRT